MGLPNKIKKGKDDSIKSVVDSAIDSGKGSSSGGPGGHVQKPVHTTASNWERIERAYFNQKASFFDGGERATRSGYIVKILLKHCEESGF